MSRGNPLISVVVPSVRSTTVANTIDSIRGQTDSAWELIVSDQSGNDAVAHMLEARGDARMRHLVCPGRGASMARNFGILHARGDIIAFTDDDCCPRPDWLAKVRYLFESDADLWMVTGSIVPPPTMPTTGIHVCPSYVPEELRARPSEGGPRIYSVTANAAYRRAAFTQAGPFDICLSPGTEFCGGEEDDHGQRMELFNPVLLSTAKLEVEHTYGVRSGFAAAWRIKRNYAYSVGAIAGKRALLGDPLGHAMISTETDMLREGLKRPWKGAFVRSLPRVKYVREGYRRIREAYNVDSGKRLLVPNGRTLSEIYEPISSMLQFRLP